jgi:CHAD domain-containing protein
MTQKMPMSEPDQTTDTGLRAIALFDGAAAAHGLPAHARRLLALAASYHFLAHQAGADRTDRAGRDLALDAPIAGLSADEQAIVASVAAFQREKLRPNREPAFLRLGERDQHVALSLAAILRIADLLDTEQIAQLLVHTDDHDVTLIIGGERTAELTRQIEARAGQWREAIGGLEVRAAAPGEITNQPPTTNGGGNDDSSTIALSQTGAPRQPAGGEPMAEYARRTLRRFFDKLLAREEAVIKDEDIEDVHQMRVATRRLRASLQVAVGVYQPKLIRRYRRGLRRIAESLGAVRDGDVFLEHVLAYRDILPEAERAQLGPLVEAVTAERARARKRLLADLEAKRYQKFKRAFAEFLTTPGAGTLESTEPIVRERVRDFAGSAIWRRYELWRCYEVALPNATNETLHQARIAGKRLRYTLEFCAEALGPNVEQSLKPLIDLQENLGALQDGVTARAHIAELGLANDPGAQDYLAAREQERGALLAELPRLWEKVGSATYRRRLFELIVKL